MKLNYKASNIAKAERESGKKFFEIFSKMSETPSFDDLLFLVQTGGGTESDFDELIAKGMDETILAIMEGINDAGFLGSKVDLTRMRKEMEAARKEPAVSQSSGETTKS